MGRTSRGASDFVKPRFGPWLTAMLARSSLNVGDLGRVLARGPCRNQDQAGAVRSYLSGNVAPTPERAFQIGQALLVKPPSPGSEPMNVGGLIALHAAGHFRESLGVLLALLDERDNAEARAYGACFAASCWLAHADLDGLSIVGATFRDSLLYEYLGAAPVKSLQIAWDRFRRDDCGTADRALLALVQNAIPYESKPEASDDIAACPLCL